MRRLLVAALVAALVALLWWQWQMPDAPPDTASGNGSASNHLSSPQSSDGRHQNPGGSSQRTLVAAPQPEQVSTDPTLWTIQLEGIDPSVPWTAPLQVVFEGRFDIKADVAADGCCRFAPPPGARLPGNQHLRLLSKEPNYRFASAHGRTDLLQSDGAMSFTVYPVAQLRGRVLDPEGNPTAARIRAFPWASTGPSEPLVAIALADADGRYTLQVPPTTPLLVVADLEANNTSAWSSFVSPLERYGKSNAIDQLKSEGKHAAQPEVLPATLRAAGTFGTPRELPDLNLGATAALTGTLKSRDGQPLRLATVTASPTWAQANSWHGQMHWSPSHGSVRGASTYTDDNGRFTLHLPAGATFRVHATSPQAVLYAGEPSASASAPGHLDLVAPGDLIRFQVADASTSAYAWLDIADRSWPMDQRNEFAITLPPTEVRVRARAANQATPWIVVPAGERPRTWPLHLGARELPTVRVTINNAPQLSEVLFHWQPLPSGTPWTWQSYRRNANQAMVMHVPLGHYELLARDVADARGGGFVMSQPHRVEVTPTGLATTIDVTFGGRLSLDVHDANGTPRGGTFTLTNSSGVNVTPRTLAFDKDRILRGAIGELQAISSNQLAAVFAPGAYTLTVHIPGHGRVQQTVTVTTRRNRYVPITVR